MQSNPVILVQILVNIPVIRANDGTGRHNSLRSCGESVGVQFPLRPPILVRVQVPYPAPTSVKLRYIYKDVPRNSHEILIPYRRTADSG